MTSVNKHPSSDQAVSDLRGSIRGTVILPGDDIYDDTREIWNAMIDRRPAIIVRPRGAADVMTAVSFAMQHGLEIAIKGGGHNVAGNAVCNDGLMLDFSDMTSIQVDPAGKTVRVEPGVLISDLDRETQAHGLATPGGFISSTGLAGLTLGGGFGYLSRKHGLTVDNLRAADLVSAEGKFIKASADNYPDLFWGIRGGGGNFGVVTAFEFDLHKLGPRVIAGPVVHDFNDARQVLWQMADAMRGACNEISCLPVIRHAPPAPFIPEQYHGKLIILFGLIYTGDPAKGEAALAPLRAIGNPVADAVSEIPYTAFQSMFDKTANAGARNYWKAHYMSELSSQSIDILCQHAKHMTSAESSIGMLSMGGAVLDQSADSAPYPHRNAQWVLNIQSRWREADEDERHIAWAREAFEAISPFSTGGVYVNFLSGGEGDERIRAAYGDTTYKRLAKLKQQWDPENVFHLNQNITPAKSDTAA